MTNNKQVNQNVGHTVALKIETTTNSVLHIFLWLRYMIQCGYCSIYSMRVYYEYTDDIILDGQVCFRIGRIYITRLMIIELYVLTCPIAKPKFSWGLAGNTNISLADLRCKNADKIDRIKSGYKLKWSIRTIISSMISMVTSLLVKFFNHFRSMNTIAFLYYIQYLHYFWNKWKL